MEDLHAPSNPNSENRAPVLLRPPSQPPIEKPNGAVIEGSPETALDPAKSTAKPTTKPSEGKLKKRLKIVVALFIGIGVAILGTHVIQNMMRFETTDDAFVAAHVHTITAKVPGMVTQVLVDDHMFVKRGQLLVRLDPRDYEAQLRIAQSRNRKAARDVARMRLGHDSYDPDEEGNVEGVDLTGPDSYAPDEQKILDDYHSSASESSDELRRAVLNIEYTSIRAPEDGRIGKRSVETGQVIAAGQALMALVEPEMWINANFKETQLGRIRVGQKVDIEVDAIPDHKFTGVVDSIAAASGSTYSLLPPDNATGNFTKVVQRVPVKVVFDPASIKGFEERVAAGMSTEVSVRVRE